MTWGAPSWITDPQTALFGIPIVESDLVPADVWYLLAGPPETFLVRTAVPVVPFGEILCSRSTRHLMLTGPCPSCKAVV